MEDLLQIVTDNLQAIQTNYKLFLAYDRHLVQEIINHLITIHIQISIWGLKEKAHYIACDNQLEQFVENSIINIWNQVYTPKSLTDPTLPRDMEWLKNFLFTRKLL